MERFIAFDVETPNYFNDRMSQIGIAVVEGGVVTETLSSLINPEEHFDYFNIRLTGITPEAAAKAPTFDEVWSSIGPLMQSGVLVAHNASFDMGVLSKCLRAYGFSEPDLLPCACTVQMGRRAYPALADHKLDTMCRHLGIPLDHHKADSDALACANLLIDYGQKGLIIDDYVRLYDLRRGRSLPGRYRPCR
jgi:DNA polymerase III epsilon subunit family exonuclease